MEVVRFLSQAGVDWGCVSEGQEIPKEDGSA